MTSEDYNKLAETVSPEAFHTIHTEREKAMLASRGRIKEIVILCSMCEEQKWKPRGF